MKIVMLEPLEVNMKVIQDFQQKFEAMGHTFVTCYTKLNENEKIAILNEADIAVIGSEPFTKAMFEKSNKLKYISVGFTGVDHLCSEVLNSDVKISNASGYATISTAELTINLMLNVLRNTIVCDSLTRNEQTKAGYVGNELSGKTVGIVGVGKIGSHVANILKAFGCNILFYDFYRDVELENIGIYTTFETLLKASDVVSLHLPYNEDTHELFNVEAFELMKNDAILINCARGKLINDKDLVFALNNGLIRSAGLDVFDVEPPLPRNHILLQTDRIIVTPHVAFATKESMVKRANIVFENIEYYLDNKLINEVKG